MIQKNWQELIKPLKLNVDGFQDNKKHSRVIAEPLERGFGLTLGNALRRIMLSSLQGSAITGVQIEGIQHEFGSIPGVMEDVTEIIMNLKGLSIKKHSDMPKKLRLKAEGPGVIKASQFESNSDIEILDPDLVICTLDKDAKIALEVTVKNGKGYIPAGQQVDEEVPIGMIPIDAIYSPVRRVSYKVENTRVGQRTDFDKLILDIETNGSLTPEDAVALASRILQDQLQRFINFEEPLVTEESHQDTELPFSRNLLIPVANLELSVRSSNCLLADNVIWVGDLVQKSETDLLRTPNFGRKSLNEIKEVLANMGLELVMKVEGWPPENIEDLTRRNEELY